MSPTLPITVTADTALTASKTQFFHPEVVTWQVPQSGAACNSGCAGTGTSQNPIYVTLGQSLTSLSPLMLSYVSLAVGSGGATNASSAVTATWNEFSTGSAPANVKTWDGRQMFYYAPNVGFQACALAAEALVQSNSILSNNLVSGQCGAFALLLESALAANGLHSSYVDISTSDNSLMVINSWTVSNTPTYPSQAPWQYKLLLNVGDYMVPALSAYGDLTNLIGVAGQGNAQPSEKVFNTHYIVQYPVGGSLWYDPSYGVTYSSAAGFESQSVKGYAKPLAPDTGGMKHFRNAISPPLAPNITFTVNPSLSM